MRAVPDAQARSHRPSTVPLALGWAVVAWIAFAGTLDAFFAQDDFWLLQAVQQPLPHRGMYAGTLPDYVRPLTTFWFPWVNVQLFGLQAYEHHLMLLLVHAAATAALFVALHRWTGSLLGASFGVAVYALSEVHLVTLGWFAGAGDPLCALGMFVALWAIAAGRTAAAIAGLVFALLAKEHAAVLPCAFAATLLTERFFGRRADAADRRLLRAFVATGVLYVVFWFSVASRSDAAATAIGFDPLRAALVLRHSLLVVLPGIDYGDPISSAWVLAPPALAAATLRLGGRGVLRDVAFGFWLWLGAAALFALTTRPAFLENYYAHFSVVGLAVLLARFVAEVARRWDGGRPARYAQWAVLLAYAIWSTVARIGDVARAETPSLRAATYSQAFAKALDKGMRSSSAEHVHVLFATDDVWWATGKGALVPVLHPGTSVTFAGHDPAAPQAPATQLVLRQTGERTFEVVR